MERTIDDHFADWETEVFGFGYGSGEEHVLGALKTFLENCPKDGCYDYQRLEQELSPATAWMLINALCKWDILEYGTSPRGAWLTDEGKALKAYVGSHTVEQLCNVVCRDCDSVACTPSFCNCGHEGYVKGKLCHNPFWVERK